MKNDMDPTRGYSHPSQDNHVCTDECSDRSFGPDAGISWTPKPDGMRHLEPGEKTPMGLWPTGWYAVEGDTEGLELGRYLCEDCGGTFQFYITPDAPDGAT